MGSALSCARDSGLWAGAAWTLRTPPAAETTGNPALGAPCSGLGPHTHPTPPSAGSPEPRPPLTPERMRGSLQTPPRRGSLPGAPSGWRGPSLPAPRTWCPPATLQSSARTDTRPFSRPLSAVPASCSTGKGLSHSYPRCGLGLVTRPALRCCCPGASLQRESGGGQREGVGGGHDHLPHHGPRVPCAGAGSAPVVLLSHVSEQHRDQHLRGERPRLYPGDKHLWSLPKDPPPAGPQAGLETVRVCRAQGTGPGCREGSEVRGASRHRPEQRQFPSGDLAGSP